MNRRTLSAMVPCRMNSRSLVLIGAFALGCGGDVALQRATAVRDSSGVRIVENRGPAWTAATQWRVDSVPALIIGAQGSGPEYELYRVRGAVRTASGDIVVASMGTHELRFFDPSGTFLTRVGGQGQGPGEFGQLESLHRFPGDSLLAMDWVQSRLSIFTPEGDFVRSALLQPGGPGLPQVIGVLEDGTLVAIIRSLQPQSPRGAGFIREPSLYLAYDSHGMLVDTIGELPDYEVYVQADGSSTSPSSPFNRWAGTAAAGRYFYYGSGSANEVQILTRSGILAGIVRWSAEPRPVGKEDVEEYRRRRLKDVTDPDRRRDIERELARTEHPAFMPAHRSLEVDTEGYLWVESFRPSEATPALWNVFNPEGTWLGEVEIPSGLQVLDIGPDYILGRWVDEQGVEQIRLYRLHGRDK